MSLGVDNVVQENSGTMSSTSTSIVVTLPSGTTAGTTLLVMVATAGSITTPAAGFLTARTQATNLWSYYKPDVAAAETSWTFTLGVSGVGTWYVAELTNVELTDPYDGGAGTTGTASNGGTVSTGTTPLNSGLSTVAFAMFTVVENAGDVVSWSGYTNGFEEVADVSATIGTSGYYGLAVARKFIDGTTGLFECTATLATTNVSSIAVQAQIVLFRAADSPIVAPLAHLLGFEQGTHGGATATNGSTGLFGGALAPVGTWGTNYLVQAGSARNSAYGLRIVQSAGAAYVRCCDLQTPTLRAAAFGFNTRVVSATGTVVVAEVADNGLATVAQLLYDSAATQFGVRCGTTGTTQWQAGTTALNTWVWVDLRVRVNTTTWTADWRIETGTGTYTDQAQASLTGQTARVLATMNLGGNATQTMTADFDDVVVSRFFAAYPLGPHEIRLLTVDPAGTPTISGTTTNFSTFASNGTLTAWNATTARNAVDEVPVTISAAADGVTQTAAAASDYMEFPMSTYTLGPTEYVAGVRMMAAIGSGTGAGAGDIAVRGWDGTTETALATVSQLTPGSPTAITSTVPLWRCAMWQSTNGWTQAELDAAALRAGFSGDATPDMWIHVLYLEVAIGQTKTSPLFGTMASAQVDPTRLGVASVTTTAPDAGAASLYYEQGGSPTTVPVAAGTTVTSQVNSAMQEDTNYVAVSWPPEGVPDA